MQALNVFIIPILMTLFLMFSFIEHKLEKEYKQNLFVAIEELDMLPIQNIKMKDTVLLKGNSFVEISLNEQLCRLYVKDSNNDKGYNCVEYKISSGNPNISEGLETTTGLFTVQTKNPLGISKQFNEAELHHWVGFNVNFGIHGLAGNGYYRTLGIRPSSHGCVRISREDGKALYDKVTFGTPVLVYKNEPAITLKFIDTITSLSKYYLLPSDARSFNNMVCIRQQNIYDGNIYLNNYKKLLLDGETIIRWGGYRIGNANDIPYKQKIKNPNII